MKTKLLMGHWLGCIVLALLCFFTMDTYAMAATIYLEDIDSGLTSPAGNYRWLDVANQAYSADYRVDNYNYTQASVEVTYQTAGNTLHGTLVATNLKPNFAYQLKLAGTPGTPANERIGLAGRWWQEIWDGTKWTGGTNLNIKGDGSSPNPNDLVYFDRRYEEDPTSPTGLKYRYTGYLVFDYFITDEDGNATIDFFTNSSYHVLWKTAQRAHNLSFDGPLKSVTFDADLSSCYDDTGGDDYEDQTIEIFGEWERLPVRGVYLQPGDYSAEIILTEESFHGSGGQYTGGWAAAMGKNIEFTIIEGTLVIEAEDASLKTVGGPIGESWCLWSNGTLAEDVYFPADETYEVVVRAYGSPLWGIWPAMSLDVDGVEAEMTTVDSAGYIDYSFQVELTAGVHSIGVSFLNDDYDPGVADRNLYVDRFVVISPIGVAPPELPVNALVIEAEDASLKTVGGPIGESWCLWSNGTLAEDVYFPADETYEVVVRAYGSPLWGIWPAMSLDVDGVEAEMTTVDSAGYIDYSFQVELTAGVHSIGVSFLNDDYDPGVADRNLYVDRFVVISPIGVAPPELPVNALVIEAEDASLKTVGGPIGESWCLWSNGTLAEDVYFPADETYEVVVRAYGSPLWGIWPAMSLDVDGVEAEMTTVDSAGYIDYSFQVELTAGVHSIGVSFLNDDYDPGVADRNLYVDRFVVISPIGVAGPVLASE